MKIGDNVKVLPDPLYILPIQKQRIGQRGRIVLVDTVTKTLRYHVLFGDGRSVTFGEKEIEIEVID